MGRGRFIVIEGMDGSGKSTQAVRLADWLDGLEGHSCVGECEPTRGPVGRVIRSSYELLDESDPAWLDDRTMALLFAADRRHHCREIGALLEAGHHVVCDRYVLSSMVYQCFAFTGEDEDRDRRDTIRNGLTNILRLNQSAGALVPDLTIFLNVSAGEAQRRIRERGERTQRFETDLAGVHRRYVLSEEPYALWAERNRGAYLSVRGDNHRDSVHQHIVRIVRDLFLPEIRHVP